MNDPFDLRRFVDAQQPVIARVQEELARGRKTSHWMWFVFPQVRGLGVTATSVRYAIASGDEAAAYLAHPLLGPRLVDCTRRVVAVDGRSLHDIFGSPDDLKFHSSMTLFAQVADRDPVFDEALAKYCDGVPDRRTLELLGRTRP